MRPSWARRGPEAQDIRVLLIHTVWGVLLVKMFPSLHFDRATWMRVRWQDCSYRLATERTLRRARLGGAACLQLAMADTIRAASSDPYSRRIDPDLEIEDEAVDRRGPKGARPKLKRMRRFCREVPEADRIRG